MKPVSPRVVVYFLLALMVFALACATGSRTTTRSAQQTYEHTPMAGGQFMDLHASLQAEPDAEVRMERLKLETAGHHFVTSQVRSFVALFETREYRMEALETLRHQIVDMNNSYSVVTSFPQEEQNQAHAILQAVHDERRAAEEAERQRAAAEQERARAEREQERAERESQRAERQSSLQGFVEGAAGAVERFDERTGASQRSSSLPPAGATAMSASSFADLKRRINDAHMSRDKLGVISTAASSNYFSASQVAELIGTVDMANDRISVVETTAPRILDMENNHVVLDALTFGRERREAEAILQPLAEARERERARIAEEERRREEARRAEQERRQAERQASQSSSSGGGSAYCCITGRYNECDSGAAAAACGNYAMCIFSCMMGSDESCPDECLAENPLVHQCRAVPSNDHLCDN